MDNSAVQCTGSKTELPHLLGLKEAEYRHLPTLVPNFKVYLISICLKSIRTHLIIMSIPICASHHKNPQIPMILLNIYILNSIRL